MSVKAELYDVIRKPIITEKATMASENGAVVFEVAIDSNKPCLLYTSPSPRDGLLSRMPSSA